MPLWHSAYCLKTLNSSQAGEARWKANCIMKSASSSLLSIQNAGSWHWVVNGLLTWLGGRTQIGLVIQTSGAQLEVSCSKLVGVSRNGGFRLSLILFIPNCLCLCLIEDFLVVLNSNDCRKAQIDIYTCPACINFLFTSFCRERIVWPLHLNIKWFYYYHTLLVLPCGGFQQVETAAAVVYHGEINELPQNASPRDCYTRLVNEVIIVSRRSLYRKSWTPNGTSLCHSNLRWQTIGVLWALKAFTKWLASMNLSSAQLDFSWHR